MAKVERVSYIINYISKICPIKQYDGAVQFSVRSIRTQSWMNNNLAFGKNATYLRYNFARKCFFSEYMVSGVSL